MVRRGPLNSVRSSYWGFFTKKSHPLLRKQSNKNQTYLLTKIQTHNFVPIIHCIMTMSDDDSSIHSSSSSDDEFLTSTGTGGGSNPQDREALVRKKLLESFYGASAVASASPTDTSGAHDGGGGEAAAASSSNTKEGNIASSQHTNDSDDDDDDNDVHHPPNPLTEVSCSYFKSPSQIPLPFTATKSDLDSPNFHPSSHTLSHIAHSNAHTLLETNERLALDIRTLDSTMQTLVYENYSKFIDATDAIKSIGTNVTTTGESSLDRLQLAMDRIQQSSQRSEQLLRASREAVADKLRIQRLLTRLDALLCLPNTLRTYIGEGKMRMAIKSHKSATEILGRHSAGFESLRSIEAECGEILKELVMDLKEKLLWWSGGGGGDSGLHSFGSEAHLPPNSIAEIFECAGSLLMLESTTFSAGLDRSQCQSLALAACGQFLKERLDTVRGSGTLPSSPVNSPARKDKPNTGISSELPLSFLDGILESTTLFGVSFQDNGTRDVNHASERELLGKFVTDNFDRFIRHVKMLLIRHNEAMSKANAQVEEESSDDANFVQISLALSQLLRSVRELASGLALPEVGLDLSIASALVDQTVELTEMLVRRRVAMKFYGLREVIVRECLAPLVREVVQSGFGNGGESKEDEPKSLPLVEMIQLANVALSDGLQMADDLIRATLQRSEAAGEAGVAAPVDSAVVKVAVQKNARLLGVWLASTLEQLVGFESPNDDTILLEVIEEHSEEDAYVKRTINVPQLEGNEEDYNAKSTYASSSSSSDDSIVDSCTVEVANLILQLDDGAPEKSYSNFLLSVCEMCRLAERSMANTLNQSIQSAMDEESRVAESANTLFATGINPHRKGKDILDAEQVLAQRFRLAASRSLSMYIMNRGARAASELCSEIYELSDARDPYAIPSRPREVCFKVLEIVKSACEDCISIVGGDLFVAPVAPFPDDQEYADVFGTRMTQHSSGGASRGLQLDVERMFIEKTQVYPHSLDQVEFTRNSVVSGILLVALSSFLECVRSSVFSSLGYRQMKVDAIFLRYLFPHFVKDEFGTAEANARSCLFNALDDIMLKAGQRCVDPEVVADDDYYDAEKDEIVTPYLLVRQFLLSSDEEEAVSVMKRISFS